MAKNIETNKSGKPPSALFNFPLNVTPEKLVIPSSGHLDVQITNPMSEPFQVIFVLYSFYFDVERAWYLKDGKEVYVNIQWKLFPYIKAELIQEFDMISNSKIFSRILESEEVLHIRIKCEDKFDGIKKKFTYDQPNGYLHIKCEVKIDHVVRNQKKIQFDPKFHLKASSYIPLSIDPECEKAKELAEKYSEQQKHQVRRQRIKNCRFGKEQKESKKCCWDYEEVTVNEKTHEIYVGILTKYGSKIDKLSDDEISKIKVDYEKEKWRKLDEEAPRQKEQQAAEDAKREEAVKKQIEEELTVVGMKKEKKKAKKCVLM
uniref:Major sperm protein n=1 Tax=Caenorhabditis tropicalis TaxID=1561998 RepID=A0A1I7UPI1_9PELO